MTATSDDVTGVRASAGSSTSVHPGAGWAPGACAGVFVLVLLTRIPLLGHGYGGDPDAWRAISAAQHLLDTGIYVPSRVPGYPLPEYVDAIMLSLGVGSAVGIGLLSAALSGASAALFLHLLLPLGRARAALGAVALAFTPVVYVASLGAMDYLWGLTFFLAATAALRAGRIWWAAIFLGLAAASRPSYALGVIPLVLTYLEFDPSRLGDRTVRRSLAVLTLCSGLIALAFFVPAFLSLGVQSPKVYGDWKYLVYNVSLGLFGVAGFVAVVCAAVAAWFNRRRGVELPRPLGPTLDGWAVTMVIVYGLLFAWLPDEASYLMPALLGAYWLLCRYAPRVMLLVLAVALPVSCFFGTVERHDGAAEFTASGPVLRDLEVQDERGCVAAVVAQRLAASSDGLDYVIAGAYRPQLLVEIAEPLAGRILYTVRPDASGRLVDSENVPVPADAHLLLLDRVTEQQFQTRPVPGDRAAVLDSYGRCPARS